MTRSHSDMEAFPPSLDELLAHAGWVRALARRLADDAGAAEDLAQDTWLAALRRPPGSRANLRAWLARVVAHRAASLGRSESRRTRREREHAAHEALPATDELLGALDQQARVAAAVRELEEPYRTTLLLHFYRGLSPSEIARRENLPPGTVRSRLKRGLDLLRARFDAEHGGDRRAWSVALAAWAGPEEVALGGLGLTIAATLLLGVAGSGAWLAWRALRPTSAPEDVARANATVDDGAGEPERGSLADRQPGARREPGTAPASESVVRGSSYHGHVYAQDLAPVVGAALSLHAVNERAGGAPLATGRTDEAGRFAFVLESDVAPAELRVSAPGFVPREQALDPERECALELAWSVEVEGFVRDAESSAALVGACVTGAGQEARTDSVGRFRLAGFPSGRRSALCAAAAGHAPTKVEVFLRGPGPDTLEFALRPARSFEVEVVDRESGQPLAGATLRAFSGGGPLLATTDAAGRATLACVAGEALEVELAHASAFASRWEWTPAPDEAPPRPTFPLRRQHWIEGRVLDDAGESLEGVWVYAVSDATFGALEAREFRARHGIPGQLLALDEPQGTRTDDAGTFRAACYAAELPWHVEAYLEGWLSAKSAPLLVRESAPDPRGVELRLEPAAVLSGRVLEGGRPVHWSYVGFRAQDGRLLERTLVQSGRYRFTSLPPGTGTLLVLDDEDVELPGSPRIALTLASGERYEQDLEWGDAWVELSGRVREARGRAVPDATVGAWEAGTERMLAWVQVDSSGSFTLHTPPDLDLLLRADRERHFEEARWNGPAGASGVELVFPLRAFLRLRVLEAASGAPVRASVVAATDALVWKSADGRSGREDAALDPDGRIVLALAPGQYDVSLDLEGTGYLPGRLQGLVVGEDDEREHELRLERGLEAWVRLEPPPTRAEGDSLVNHLVFLVEEHQLDSIAGPFAQQGPPATLRINGICMRLDDPTLMEQLLSRDDFAYSGRTRLAGLRPGRYVARSYPDDYAFEPAVLDLTGPGPHELVLSWRRR